MFPQYQARKDTIVAFATNKMLQGCVGKVERFKRSDVVGTSVHRGSVDYISINPTLDILSATLGNCNFQG